MIVDKVLGYLCLKKTASEWTEPSELEEIVEKFGLTHEGTREVVSFLEKYFLEADERSHKVRVLDSVTNLYVNWGS